MKLFTYVLSSRILEEDSTGISMVTIDVFAKTIEEADKIVQEKFSSYDWNTDDFIEN